MIAVLIGRAVLYMKNCLRKSVLKLAFPLSGLGKTERMPVGLRLGSVATLSDWGKA